MLGGLDARIETCPERRRRFLGVMCRSAGHDQWETSHLEFAFGCQRNQTPRANCNFNGKVKWQV